ncbi:hypothetical protein PbJCM13498_34120 [Prolixibacter bellariivorans]|uniref:Calcineurin-like phosphoesterase domain-containing protein n=1 Tax=Prolixibacter bellariivorans TaxID=314319 RepID=A0A5M4B311_9BACT|nr:metallophosphoesterase [Prolixibacter bellariivorans]GET34549.1 hypothetical protein PbJCM13498_34120 [Prolixibacter bellariivorans]
MKKLKSTIGLVLFIGVLLSSDLSVMFVLKEYHLPSNWILLLPVFFFVMWTLVLNFRNYFLKPERFKLVMRLIGLSLLYYIPKLLFLLFFLISQAGALLSRLFSSYNIAVLFEGFATTFLVVGLIAATVTALAILHGIIWGRFLFQTEKKNIQIDNLPAEFEGLTLLHLSDFHIGCFQGHLKQLQKGIRKCMDLNPDVILFTGDLTTVYADEIKPFLPTLKELKAPCGLFSVLGNHSYGGHDYFKWNEIGSPEENLEKICQFHQEIGFTLLKNQAHVIERNGQKLAIIGIENWGLPPFPQAGDLDKAMENVHDISTKILLSHDPSFWEQKVMNDYNIPLTLSGHTHAMQLGVKAGNFAWSPSRMKYRFWSGLYEANEKYLYVNRGFGHVLFPARIGMFPEITFIKLTSA